MQKAIIYCRVSSERQVKQGHGLDSQEKRCRDYAKGKKYKIAEVFPDEGVSGSLFQRPAMKALIEYLDANPLEHFVVIFDDLSRFARDVKVHIQLKSELISRGVTLECLNFSFEDSEESEFAELVMAASNQYQRKNNRRQVIQKMLARLQDGFWPFCTPPALVNKEHPVYKRLLFSKEPYSTIFKNAIENYHGGLLNTLEDVQYFVLGEYKKVGITRVISINGAQRILTNPLYAGWLEYKPWGVPLQKAKHEGFISKVTFDAVQDKLKRKANVTLRKDLNLDFPLRGFVVCKHCLKPNTGSWHKGRSQSYAHYFCKQFGCSGYNRNIPKDTIEDQFEALISDMTPTNDVMQLTKAILNDVWENRSEIEEESKGLFLKEIDELEAKRKNFMDRIGKTTNDEIITQYEQEITEILKRKKELEGNLPTKIYSPENFGTACDVVISKIEKPVLMWQSDKYADKRLLLEMYFDEKLPYDRNEGFGTVTLACLPKLLCFKENDSSRLVEMGGVEPPSAKAFYKRYS